MTATMPSSTTGVEDRYEPEEWTVIQLLGLGPSAMRTGDRAPHPDSGPCPTWCWIGQQAPDGDGYTHEIDPSRPYEAQHTLDTRIPIPARLYPASKDWEADRIDLATIEPWLEQAGRGEPVIGVALRWYADDRGKSTQYDHDRLRMHPDEVRDLIKVLQHLLSLVDADIATETLA